MLCRKKIRGAKCGKPVAQLNDKYCPDHSCGHPGCKKPKAKKATGCKEHIAIADHHTQHSGLYKSMHVRMCILNACSAAGQSLPVLP